MLIRSRNPAEAQKLYEQLTGHREATPSVAAVLEAQRTLREAGFDCPEWQLVWNGARPAQVTEQEPGEWKHGWQYFAATRLFSFFESFFLFLRERSVEQVECLSSVCALVASYFGPSLEVVVARVPHTVPRPVEACHCSRVQCVLRSCRAVCLPGYPCQL